MKADIVPRYTHWGITISVYRTGTRYSAQFVLNGSERMRVERGSEHLALIEAKALIETRLGSDPSLSFEEKCASEILAPWGMTVMEAARMVANQLHRLKPADVSIPAAVDYYVQTHLGTSVPVNHVVDELLKKTDRDAGKHYTDDLRRRLKNRFCLKFGERKISSITVAEIAAWVDEQPGVSRTRRNFHSALVTLFKFAKERGYVSENHLTAAEKVKKPKAGRSVRLIITPDELASLLRAAVQIRSPGLAPLVIQCFAGVRAAEICQNDPKKDRLRLRDLLLDQDEPEIHVRPEVSKTDEERYVHVPPCLLSWLRTLCPGSGAAPIYSGNQLWKDYAAISAEAKISWKKNGPRKSFNTYYSALSGSLSATAGEAGNSEQIIRRYYRKEIPQAQKTAKEWFSLGSEVFAELVAKYLHPAK